MAHQPTINYYYTHWSRIILPTFGYVLQAVVDARLGEVCLCEHLLVIELLELAQQLVDELEGLHGLLGLQQQGAQLGFDALSQEGPLLQHAPRDHVVAQVDLDGQGVGHQRYDTQDTAHYLSRLCLWDYSEQLAAVLREDSQQANMDQIRSDSSSVER